VKTLNSIDRAILHSFEYLQRTGQVVKTKTWQGVEAPQPMFEAMDLAFKVPIPEWKTPAIELIQPNMPWAEEHFQERISGIPLNPPPSHKDWPFGQQNNEAFTDTKQLFDHTYPERFWPKYANRVTPGNEEETLKWLKVNKHPNQGIRFEYGDLDDVTNLLIKDPETRQAYLPVFFPEDTGAKGGKHRVPCSLGYHFMIRQGYLHVGYTMRSCDAFRHFQDDLYMACRLAHYVQASLTYPISMGYLKFVAYSYHIFGSEQKLLDQKINKWKDQVGN
jgi:hypothetical protein